MKLETQNNKNIRDQVEMFFKVELSFETKTEQNNNERNWKVDGFRATKEVFFYH